MYKFKNILLITALLGLVSACSKDEDVQDTFEGIWRSTYTIEDLNVYGDYKVTCDIIEEYEFGKKLIHRTTHTSSVSQKILTSSTLTIDEGNFFFKDDSLYYTDYNDYKTVGYTQTEQGYYKGKLEYFKRGHYIKRIDNTKIIIDSLIYNRIK